MSFSTFWFSTYYLFCLIFFYITFSRYFLSASYHSTYYQDTQGGLWRGLWGGLQWGLHRRLPTGLFSSSGPSQVQLKFNSFELESEVGRLASSQKLLSEQSKRFIASHLWKERRKSLDSVPYPVLGFCKHHMDRLRSSVVNASSGQKVSHIHRIVQYTIF